MRRAFWTTLAIGGAVLVETALGHLWPGLARSFDPFLLVVVYCALVGGESHGMLAGACAGWVQDALFGGPVLGLGGLSKLLVGFAVGLAGSRFLIASPLARGLALLLATLADSLLLPWLGSVFDLPTAPLGLLALLLRAAVNAALGSLLFAVVERRLQRERL